MLVVPSSPPPASTMLFIEGNTTITTTSIDPIEGFDDAVEASATGRRGERRNTWSSSIPSRSGTTTTTEVEQRPHAASEISHSPGKCCTSVALSTSPSELPITRPPSPSPSSSSSTSSSLTPSTSPVQEGVEGYYRKKDEEKEERGEDTSMLKMEERKLFLGGLPSNCDKQELKDYFSQFGEIEDSIVMMDRVTGRSRGFGFITFLHPQDMEACLDDSPHVVMDKTIDVKRAVEGGLGPRITRHEGPMKDAAWSENNYMGYHYNRGVVAGPGGGYRAYTGGKGGGGSSSSSSYTLPYRVPDDPKKVFIGGLPPCADNNSLTRMLSQYGSVVSCNVMFDRGTGRNRGFGYATFSTPREANDACHGGDNNVMDGKWVEVKPCTRLEFPTTEGAAAAAANVPKSPSSSAMYGGQQRGEGYRAEQQWRQKEKLLLPDDPCKVFLGGLPQSADQSRVTEHLSQYGHVQEVTVMYDRETGRHRGFAYATFSNNDEAMAAINGNNVIHGKLVQVKPSSRSMEHVGGNALQHPPTTITTSTCSTQYHTGTSNPKTATAYHQPQPPPQRLQHISPYTRGGVGVGGDRQDTYTTGYHTGKRQEIQQQLANSRYHDNDSKPTKSSQQLTAQEGGDELQPVHDDADQRPSQLQQQQLEEEEEMEKKLGSSPHKQQSVPWDRSNSIQEEEEQEEGQVGDASEGPIPEAAAAAAVAPPLPQPGHQQHIVMPQQQQQQQQMSTTLPPGMFIPMNQQQLGYTPSSQYEGLVMPSVTTSSLQQQMPPQSMVTYNGIPPEGTASPPLYQQGYVTATPAFIPIPPPTQYSPQQAAAAAVGMVSIPTPASTTQQQYPQLLPSHQQQQQRFFPQFSYPVGPTPPTSMGIGYMPPMFGTFQCPPPQQQLGQQQDPQQQQQQLFPLPPPLPAGQHYRSGPY